MSALKLAKDALRKDIERKVSLLSTEEKFKQSKTVREKLFKSKEFQSSKNVSIFLSLDTEIDTEPIVRKIFEDGKSCFVPRYNKKVMEMVELHSMKDWETLPVTKWNIKQPSFKDERRNAIETGLDLIIVPGVAFTKAGDRLGHGGGYYDKFLTSIIQSQEVSPKTIAIAFCQQVVDEVPTEETDVTINLVLYTD